MDSNVKENPFDLHCSHMFNCDLVCHRCGVSARNINPSAREKLPYLLEKELSGWDVDVVEKAPEHPLKVEKARVDFVLPEFVFGIAQVFDEGRGDRPEQNWLYGKDNKSWSAKERVCSILRHAYKLLIGEKIDKNSGLHHALHIAANAQMLYIRYIKHNEIGKDDL